MKRKSGILLHITSLPSKYGVGDLGSEAYRFVDVLVESGCKVWQILPLGPIGPGNSPYQAYSAYAGDFIFISPDELLLWNLLNTDDLNDAPVFQPEKVEYEKVAKWKKQILKIAFDRFRSDVNGQLQNEFLGFCNEHDWWLNDYALFRSCQEKFDYLPWNEWPDEVSKRSPVELEILSLKLSEDIDFEKFVQFMFFRQWFRLKEYANHKGVTIFGDMPLYVAHNSSDVWANQQMFLLDNKGNPTMVGGVPPDYFSEDGQLWGNPLFNWDKLAETEYQWWLARLYFNFHLFNLVRIDHFRGLESFWAIPANSDTAKNGSWVIAKGDAILSILKSRMNYLPIVAEDLGIITPEVDALRKKFDLPGMKVLQFAFSSDASNEHLPHNYDQNQVVYTGTHDNNTTLAWFNELNDEEKEKVLNYLFIDNRDVVRSLIELAWSSVAEMVIVPIQDLLGMGAEGRMNTPGIASGNWEWRCTQTQLDKLNAQFIKMLNDKYNRNE